LRSVIDSLRSVDDPGAVYLANVGEKAVLSRRIANTIRAILAWKYVGTKIG